LIIRPSGEYRLSNFLIWQAAYSEFWYSDILWPISPPMIWTPLSTTMPRGIVGSAGFKRRSQIDTFRADRRVILHRERVFL
jgi:hypothetical protein